MAEKNAAQFDGRRAFNAENFALAFDRSLLA
jgi:hypothetical protein